MKRCVVLALLVGFAFAAFAQRATSSLASAASTSAAASAPPPKVSSVPGTFAAIDTPPAQVAPGSNADFLKAADEVLAQMSQLLDLPVKEPLKKTLRSKKEIREYLVREEKEDKDDAQRDADTKTLEAFGLIPKGFPLDSFMLDVLTDQIAGLYDPKAREFYIADWIPLDEQKAVMAHELTHALEDQSFHIDSWIKAARPNDDAELARESVSEGSAMAAMVDYTLRGEKMSVRDLPDVTLLIRSGAISDMDKDPNLSKAPPYLRDDLLFPYLAGTTFSQQFLKAHTGWSDLKILFANPPVSTQQIMHPEMYLAGVVPEKVTFPEWKAIVPSDWKVLEENVLGEFNLDEVLKQYLGQQRADQLAAAWRGDRYVSFEDQKTKNVPLVVLLALDNVEDAGRFAGQYSEALEKKYANRTQLFRRPNYFQFNTDSGGVYLRCVATRCLTVEGASRETFDKIDAAIGWNAAPGPAIPESSESIAQLR
ncbi:MAG TPA: hypothetical protein VG322_14455 [Candidatus Acidoferrales bacterium]|jgi:hypothetical protein|nr:hypothetical protein [Candidatus Acidoferrales bacterium]